MREKQKKSKQSAGDSVFLPTENAHLKIYI